MGAEGLLLRHGHMLMNIAEKKLGTHLGGARGGGSAASGNAVSRPLPALSWLRVTCTHCGGAHAQGVREAEGALLPAMLRPDRCLHFLRPGRLARVREGPLEWGWGVVLAVHRLQKSADGRAARIKVRVCIISAQAVGVCLDRSLLGVPAPTAGVVEQPCRY